MNLSYGSRGDDVKKLQKSLNANGYNLAVDGIYGPKTQEAVRKYQQSNGLTADGSGIFGTETSGKLYGTGSTTQNSPTTGHDQQQTQQASPTIGQTQQQTQQTTQQPSQSTEYVPSASVESFKQQLQTAIDNGPGEYTNQYKTQMDDLLMQINGREPFSYNPTEDALYQILKDQYTQQGQMAMMDTMGQAAALTGGYGSSYGQAVGQQQYNAYLQQLTDVVPDLYDRAYGVHQQEGQELQNQYAMLADLEATDYNRYQDSYNQYWDNIAFLQGEEDRAYERGVAEEERAYSRQQDNKAYLLDLMAATGYVPSAEELAAAGMSQSEADAWMSLYAPKGGSGGGYTYEEETSDAAATVASQMGKETNLAERLAILDKNKDNLDSNEYRELYNALIRPYESGSGQGGSAGIIGKNMPFKSTGMTR